MNCRGGEEFVLYSCSRCCWEHILIRVDVACRLLLIFVCCWVPSLKATTKGKGKGRCESHPSGSCSPGEPTLTTVTGVAGFKAARITAWKQWCEDNQGKQLTTGENNCPGSSGKHFCGSLGEMVQSCKWKAGYRMAARRPLALHRLRHLQHCHNKDRMGPTTLRVLSRTLLRQSEMWRSSQCWKCHHSLGLRRLPENPN